MKRKKKKAQLEARARQIDRLVADTSAGCEMFRKKILCAQPIFVIVIDKEGNSVAICLECWDRALDIGADAHVELTDIKEKYAAKLKAKPSKRPLIIDLCHSTHRSATQKSSAKQSNAA